MTEDQKQELLALLWENLSHDRDHPDRRNTGYGTKTQEGLLACIDSIMWSRPPVQGYQMVCTNGLTRK
jgi:hypothetical protein